MTLSAVAPGCSSTAELATEIETEPRINPSLLPTEPSNIPAPVGEAYCEVQVDGIGVLDMETDYLPNVVFCENGGANLEALKVQAIAARSTVYHSIATHGSICDSQGCQVYSCDYGSPSAIHFQAVEETSGMYLAYEDVLTYGFYVAGDNSPPTASCVGVPGSDITEQYVTYNEGLEQTAVEQTTLGFIFPDGDPGFGSNRGCMAQWGSRCLEDEMGYGYEDILRFYYGDDIQVLQAQGECVVETDPTGDSGGGEESGEESGDAATTGGDEPDTGVDETGDGPAEDGDEDTGAGGTEGEPPATGSGGDGPALPVTAGFGDDDGGGCACGVGGSPASAPWMWLMLVGLGLARRRRVSADAETHRFVSFANTVRGTRR